MIPCKESLSRALKEGGRREGWKQRCGRWVQRKGESYIRTQDCGQGEMCMCGEHIGNRLLFAIPPMR